MEISYDRGTLLLSNTPPGWQPLGILWDPRVGAYRSPARLYSAIRKEALLAGISLDDRTGAVSSAPAVGRWRLPELRPYQHTSLEEWESAQGKGVVVLPTGAGKTLTAFAAIARSSANALCLVPTKALLDQWQMQAKARYSGPVGVYGDGERRLEALTLATYESAYRHIGEFGNRFGLVVVDECHHFGAGLRDEILEMTTAPRRLGLTATPPSRPEASARLSELIGPVVFELSLGDLSGKYLADFDYYRLHLDLTPAERSRYELEMSAYRRVFTEFRDQCPEGSYLDWIRFASRTEEGRRALASFREARKTLGGCEAKARVLSELLARHWSRKSLIFTADNESAYRVSRRHLVMPVTADIGRREREEMIARFREDRIRALVSCRVLNEGIDVPDAEVAIILGGTHGAREHVQRIGRTLRPRPGKRAQIYELVCRGTIESRQSRKRGEAL